MGRSHLNCDRQQIKFLLQVDHSHYNIRKIDYEKTREFSFCGLSFCRTFRGAGAGGLEQASAGIHKCQFDVYQ
jgi:hypothetical protein